MDSPVQTTLRYILTLLVVLGVISLAGIPLKVGKPVTTLEIVARDGDAEPLARPSLTSGPRPGSQDGYGQR